uniref:eukaryotic translation initiation factor 4B-like isoform X1 n=1 Tax=Styela clava TaxID=7725 RepID=UPI00193ABA53|nr:eukaryotic translation initiation factor 4B-like isoform X1 [Styela clava]
MSSQQVPSQPTGKKGKKKKGTTISLIDFLGDSAPAPVSKNLDWADEADDFDGADLNYQSSYNNKKILSSLPTGPRASRTIEVDMSKLPNEPPYTAFVGNLPYEADEEMLAEFFQDLKLISVRLPEENGRFKGYGYVEFEDRHSLAQALQHNEETFNKRQIRVDVAGSKNQDGRRGNNRYGNQSFGMGGGFEGPDVTEGEWRRKPNEDFRPPQSNRGYDESAYRSVREDRRYGERDSYGRRDYGRYDSGHGQRSYRGNYQRTDSYGRDDQNRGGDYQDRGYGGDRRYEGNREYSGYSKDRGYDRSYGGDRGYGSDHGYDKDRGYGGDRRYGRDRDYGGGMYGGEKDSGYYTRSGGYRNEYNNRDGDYGRDRYQDERRDDYGRGEEGSKWRNESLQGPERQRSNEGRDEPPSRPQLKLQPRSIPLEEKTETTRSSSIFGSAKPVDTATREKQIEEKMKKDEENVFLVKDERNAYKRAPRRSSERSDDSHPTSPRRIPQRILSDKDYEDSHRRRSTSPGHQQDGTVSKDKESQRDYRPAPPPKQSAWGKRSASDKDDRGSPGKPSSSEDNADSKKKTVVPAPPPPTNQWSRGPPKIDSRGEREEAEGNAREDDLAERILEGSDDVSRNSNGSAGDGSDQQTDSNGPRQNERPRQHWDGRRDDRAGRDPPQRHTYENESDFRRRGDGGSGRSKQSHGRNQDNYKQSDYRKNEESSSRNESAKTSSSQEKKRDSSRDSRPECDRSAAAGQEHDFHKGTNRSGRRPPRGPIELEPEPAVEFVQKSKFAALALEDDEDDDCVSNGNEISTAETE